MWHKIADSTNDISFSENNITEIQVANKKICVIYKKNLLYACANKCPHAGGRMADGYIDVLENIVCPLHRYKFSLKNGRNTSGEGYYLKIFPIEIRVDGIFVCIENKNIFNWFN